jgi:hypothetical protein
MTSSLLHTLADSSVPDIWKGSGQLLTSGQELQMVPCLQLQSSASIARQTKTESYPLCFAQIGQLVEVAPAIISEP